MANVRAVVNWTFWAVTAALALGGCAGDTVVAPATVEQPSVATPRPSTPPVAPPRRPQPVPSAPGAHVPESVSGPPQGSPVVIALLDKADSQAASGHHAEAAAALERALRIEPRNPVLWQHLAQVRLDQRQYHQAVALAAKSNSLAGPRPDVQARNWRIIAAARTGLKDATGARAAAAQAAALEAR